MALISCPVCGRLVSDETKTCPQCGHMFASPQSVRTISLEEEERRWGIVDTLVVLLLLLLQAALLYFLYLNFFKWPYDSAKEYYGAEKASYESMVDAYSSAADEIADVNAELDSKMEELNELLDSGEEPEDTRYADAAQRTLRLVGEARIETPVVSADPVPSIMKDNPLHTKEILQTGRAIDQQRYALYNRFSDMRIPDYSILIEALDRAENNLTDSIQKKKETGETGSGLRETVDRYDAFVKEYSEFLKTYDPDDPDDATKAENLAKQYEELTAAYKAIDRTHLTAEDAMYLNEASFRISTSLAVISAYLNH